MIKLVEVKEKPICKPITRRKTIRKKKKQATVIHGQHPKDLITSYSFSLSVFSLCTVLGILWAVGKRKIPFSTGWRNKNIYTEKGAHSETDS